MFRPILIVEREMEYFVKLAARVIVLCASIVLGFIYTENIHVGMNLFRSDMPYYMSSAQHIVLGTLDSYPASAQWGPLYPLTLATLMGGNDFYLLVRLYNIACLALALMLSMALIEGYFPFPFAVVTAGTWLALDVTRDTYGALNSEVLFIPLVLAFLLMVPRAAYNRKAYWLLIVVTMAACLQRYAGLPLILVACLYLWSRTPHKRRRLAVVLWYGILTVTPLLFWNARNVLVVGAPFGVRVPPSDGMVAEMLFRLPLYAEAFAQWGVPLVLVGCALVLVFRRQIAAFEMELPLLFALVYFVFVLSTSISIQLYDFTGERLMLPLFAPVTLIVFGVLHRLVTLLESLTTRENFARTSCERK